MKANYQSVGDLEYDGEIQMAVEYLITQLYSFGVLKCLSICTVENREEILEKLVQIRNLKAETVQYTYEANSFVQQKIAQNDIKIMKLNDIVLENLVDIILK